MKGVHPDLIFSDWQMQSDHPYVTAKRKARAIMGPAKSKELHQAMIENPARFDLTEDELSAVRDVMRKA